MSGKSDRVSPQDPAPLELSYATDAPSTTTRVWAAAVLLLGAIALVILGGCFLIGVLILMQGNLLNGTTLPWHARTYLFCGILYLMAFACFSFAALLFIRTTAKLFKVL